MVEGSRFLISVSMKNDDLPTDLNIFGKRKKYKKIIPKCNKKLNFGQKYKVEKFSSKTVEKAKVETH